MVVLVDHPGSDADRQIDMAIEVIVGNLEAWLIANVLIRYLQSGSAVIWLAQKILVAFLLHSSLYARLWLECWQFRPGN